MLGKVSNIRLLVPWKEESKDMLTTEKQRYRWNIRLQRVLLESQSSPFALYEPKAYEKECRQQVVVLSLVEKVPSVEIATLWEYYKDCIHERVISSALEATREENTISMLPE